jgi:Domain of unknown function (DUF4476)
MKTIFTLLLSSFFSLSLLAYDGTKLTITSISNTKLYAEVNGRRYNLDGNTVSIRDIRSGYHNVKVYREVKRNNGRWWDFGIGNNRRQETLYNNRINLREGYHFDIVINRFGKVLVDERRIDRNDDWYNNDDDDYQDRDKDRDRDWDSDRDRDRDRDDRYDNNGRAMSDYDFNQAKETLRREWFENTRVTTAKQILDRNYFTSRQIKELLLLFTFENNKLDLAKHAYSRTVDKGNYYIVNDAFTFNNSKEELARYIRDYR